MDENLKIVPFKWELGEEKVSLHIDEYQYGSRLYIGITSHGEDGPEPFADMTVNLPAFSLEPNEAFINGDISKDLLAFIKENKLGKVLPYTCLLYTSRSHICTAKWHAKERITSMRTRSMKSRAKISLLPRT